ncbi:MAG TPA: LON peptidase substrate-binding domain-containing protein, partial [Chitinophagaceae bacterium]
MIPPAGGIFFSGKLLAIILLTLPVFFGGVNVDNRWQDSSSCTTFNAQSQRMSFENFFLKAEDEMDFIPIIPLNEGETESMDGMHVPAEISLLPLRNTVLFPGVVLPITVGRDKSIRAVNDAYKAEKLIGVIAQR